MANTLRRSPQAGQRRPVHRRRTLKRAGFRRVVTFLVLVLATELAWRGGLLRSHDQHHGVARITVQTVAAGGADPAPLAGRQTVSRTQTQTTLDRFISYGYPVFCGGGHKPLVALTFDDGPGPYTQRVVEMLNRAGARATFFIVAKEIKGWPRLANEPRREADVGAIGDHTYNHVDLMRATQQQLTHEIVDSQQLIQQHSGVDVRLFRPPYGHHNILVDHEVQAQRMLEVLWNVDSRDGTAGTTDSQVLHNVVDGLRPGAIVLMHENRGTTLHDLPAILQAIRARGLHTVTVPELLAADPPSLSQLKTGICH